MELEAGDVVKIRNGFGTPEGNNRTHTIACAHPEVNKYFLSTTEEGIYEGGQRCIQHDTYWVVEKNHIEIVNKTTTKIRKLNSKQIVRL